MMLGSMVLTADSPQSIAFVEASASIYLCSPMPFLARAYGEVAAVEAAVVDLAACLTAQARALPRFSCSSGQDWLGLQDLFMLHAVSTKIEAAGAPKQNTSYR